MGAIFYLFLAVFLSAAAPSFCPISSSFLLVPPHQVLHTLAEARRNAEHLYGYINAEVRAEVAPSPIIRPKYVPPRVAQSSPSRALTSWVPQLGAHCRRCLHQTHMLAEGHAVRLTYKDDVVWKCRCSCSPPSSFVSSFSSFLPSFCSFSFSSLPSLSSLSSFFPSFSSFSSCSPFSSDSA
eukprot:GHVU01229509.1.p2 GENE.GHVU01229509.1~~GHVU01229509.1.p2  ORF type:complete len:181 (+),score=12.59 GHVU01229509.1:917-1459(+)